MKFKTSGSFDDLAQRPCLDPLAVRRRAARYAAPLSWRLPLCSLPRRQLAVLHLTGSGATGRRLARLRAGHACIGPHPKTAESRDRPQSRCRRRSLAKSTIAMILTGEREQIRKHHADRILAVDRTAVAELRPRSGRPDLDASQRAPGSGLYQDLLAKQLGSRAKRPSLQIETYRITALTASKVERLYRRIQEGRVFR